MPKGMKTGGRDFKPGQSGNLNGRPKLPGDIKEARALNQIEFQRVLNGLIYLTKDELKAKIMDPGTDSLTLAVATILSNAITKGDPVRLDFIINRLIGKPKETIEITNPYLGLPRTELIELAQQEIKLLKDKNE